MKEELDIYNVSIDPKYAEDDVDLGIELISNVKDPAIRVKGVAFTNQNNEKVTKVLSFSVNKKQAFADDTKYRISAPVMIPSDIYRNDEDGEYFMRFTKQDIEDISKKFMANLSPKRTFNLEHTDKMVDSFILEAFLVDDSHKQKMVKDSYGIDVPEGTFFVTQQFNNKEEYKRLVSNGQTGFSLEGFLGTYLTGEKTRLNSHIVDIKNKEQNMNKRKFFGQKRVLQSKSKKAMEADNTVFIIASKLSEEEKIEVIDDITADPLTDFTGEIEITDETGSATLIVEEGVITEIIADEPEVAGAIAGEPEPAELESDEEKKEEEEKKEDGKVEAETDEPVKEEGEDTLESLLEVIAEIKNDIAELKSKNEKENEDVEMSKHSAFMSALIQRSLKSK
jgi:hypothetical protein